MDQLRTLIIRFKDFNGEVAANVESLSPLFRRTDLNIGSFFDSMAVFLSQIYEKLAETTVFGSRARDLLKELKNFEKLLEKRAPVILELLGHLIAASI